MKHEPATVGRKLCKKCCEVKSVLAFAADPTHADGMRNQCRTCDGEYQAARHKRIKLMRLAVEEGKGRRAW